MSTPSTGFALLLAATALSLALTGCSGGDDDGASDGTDMSQEGALTSTFDASSLTFSTKVSVFVGPCLAKTRNLKACLDADGDGLVDAWEAGALKALNPVLVFDEDEKALHGRPNGSAQSFEAIGRVHRAGSMIDVNIAIAFEKDYGKGKDAIEKVVGSAIPSKSHDGDVEVVSFELAPNTDGTSVSVVSIQTSGEERDRTMAETLSGKNLARVTRFEDSAGWTHVALYVSQDIHGLFLTEARCEHYSDCSPDHVDDPADYYRLPRIMNAGEPGKATHLRDDVTSVGFADEHVWTGRTHINEGNGAVAFCGGRTQHDHEVFEGDQNDETHRCPHEIGAWLMDPTLRF